jgi:predicted flap endonuclease-1-like 5' DNA nuclease
MDSNYLIIILVTLVVATALLLLWRRRDKALPPAAGVDSPVVGKDPLEALPPETVTGVPFATMPIDVPAAVPAAPAPAAPAAVEAGPPDPLTTLKGLGPKAAAQLNALGITRYDQLAALSGVRLAEVDAQMGAFQGRLARDRWVEQAGHLAAGDVAGFEAKFGKLGG